MFHHFHDEEIHLPGQGSISGQEFRQMIIYLRSKYNLLSPDEFIINFHSNKLSNKDIALTFDDSLRCQYDIALPILEEFSLKAFFFCLYECIQKKSRST